MTYISLKNQLKLSTRIPILIVALLFVCLYHHHFHHLENQVVRHDEPAIYMVLHHQWILLKQYHLHFATIAITLFGLSVSLLFYYYLTKTILGPITRLRRSMQDMLHDAYETPINVSTPGEIGIIEQGCAHLQARYLQALQESSHSIELATADLQLSVESLEEKNIQLSLTKKKSDEKRKQMAEFLVNMSHEVRTPMNGIIGYTNVILETELNPLQRDYLKTIQSSAQDLLSVINDILDYSKLDADKFHLDCIPFDWRACMDDVLSLLAPGAHKKGLDLIPIIEANVPQIVLGDPLRVKQIISNLISNAVKFTDTGHVLIKTRLDKESDEDYALTLIVKDTGIGIAADEQKRLFHAFHQADTSITRRYGGSGLGLVIIQQLVKLMHGTITLSSALHEGTTFSVTLCFKKLTSYEAEKHTIHRFAGYKALCFDPNPYQLHALENALAHWQMPCVTVSTLEALQDALTQHTDIVVCLLHISNSCETAIIQLARKHHLSCIFLSSELSDPHHNLANERILYKPLHLQKLQESIEHVVHQTDITVRETQELNALRKQFRAIGANLLIAEDHPINRQLFESLLNEYASVHTVNDGLEALEAANKTRFSIIMLDLHMPRLNGIETAKCIREQSTLNASTPILLISADTNLQHTYTLAETGINLCMEKPLHAPTLFAEMLRLLEKDNPIDWPMCLEKLAGNHTLAVEFLGRFIEELESNRTEFLTYLETNNLPALIHTAHKLHGACCFCGVPRLQANVSQLEQEAKKALHTNAIKPLLMRVIASIDAVLHEYQQSYQTYLREENQ